MGEQTGSHQLLMLRGEEVLFSIQLQEGDAALIGRSPAAQVVLRDPEVSWMHAMVWVERGWLWVRDISSTNGTLINSRRLKEAALIERESLLQVGTTLLTLRPAPSSRPVFHPRLWVEDLSSGLRFPITDAPSVLPGGDARLSRGEDGHLCLEAVPPREGGAQQVSAGDSFIIGGRRYRVLDELIVDPLPTDFTREQGLPYSLHLAEDGTPSLVDLASGHRHTFTSPRRAEILRFLGSRLHAARVQKVAPPQQGWCDDDELGQHIWGTDWSDGSNRLNVIVHRIRRELETASFDSACLEKRRGGVRLWIQRVLILPTTALS